MTVIFEASYTLPGSDEPLTHARIAHSNNWLSGGTATASTTDADYFEDGPLDTMTYEKWKPTSLTATWQYSHTASVSADYCVIGAHDMGTQGNTLTVQYFSGSWLDACPATAITDNSPIMVIFEPKTAQNWRISISGGTVPLIGVVKFGTAMQMPRPLYGGHSPLDFGRATVMRANNSSTGEFLGRTKLRSMLDTSFQWSNIPRSYITSNWKNFQKAIETEPFFIAWRPTTFGEVGLCYVEQSPRPTAQGVRDLHEVELQVKARGYD